MFMRHVVSLTAVEHIVLRIQSLVPPFFHFLPIVLHIDSEYFDIHASSLLRNFLNIFSQLDRRLLLLVFDVHGLGFEVADLNRIIQIERLFPLIQVRFVPILQKFGF